MLARQEEAQGLRARRSWTRVGCALKLDAQSVAPVGAGCSGRIVAPRPLGGVGDGGAGSARVKRRRKLGRAAPQLFGI
eukprot:2468076-Pyramimonas_sp.AAC.1